MGTLIEIKLILFDQELIENDVQSLSNIGPFIFRSNKSLNLS